MTMASHVIDCDIHADDLWFVMIDPGETAIGEAGPMMVMGPDIRFEAKMGDGSEPD